METYTVPHATSGQSYKASMIVIYDTRVVPDLKIPHITTLESYQTWKYPKYYDSRVVNYKRKLFIWLATDVHQRVCGAWSEVLLLSSLKMDWMSGGWRV